MTLMLDPINGSTSEHYIYIYIWCWRSTVFIANRLRPGGSAIRIPESPKRRHVPGQNTVHCVLGLKTPACDVYRSPQSGAEAKNVFS